MTQFTERAAERLVPSIRLKISPRMESYWTAKPFSCGSSFFVMAPPCRMAVDPPEPSPACRRIFLSQRHFVIRLSYQPFTFCLSASGPRFRHVSLPALRRSASALCRIHSADKGSLERDDDKPLPFLKDWRGNAVTRAFGNHPVGAPTPDLHRPGAMKRFGDQRIGRL